MTVYTASYNNHYAAEDNYPMAVAEPHGYDDVAGRRHTWSSPPPKMDHNGELVVMSSDAPQSPLSYTPTEDSGVLTDVSGPSYPYDQRPEDGALVVYDQRAMVVRDDNVDGIKNPSSLPPEILKMKKNRKRATIGAGVVGGVVGLVALGPVGAVVGGVGSAVVTKQIGKRREKRKSQKLADREIARQHQNAPDTGIHSAEFS